MTAPGATIAGRYELVRQLGAGSMGAVWLASDTSLRRDVAVKSLRGPLVEGDPDGSDSTEGEQRAMREARLIARVNHPNVVAIYDVAMHGRRPWLVMEYLPSKNLDEVVREWGPLTPRRAAHVGAQVAAALADVHRTGIVHRDVKPANVLISDRGAVKVTDFGIARGHGDVTLTATGQMWGTPAYFAPEVAAGDSSPTPEADVWSLGATLYFTVEGTPPYGTDAGPFVLLGRIANQPVPEPRRAGPLAPVLARLLDRDPATRPTMVEAAALLEDVARAPEYDDTPVAAAAAPWGPSPAPAHGQSGDTSFLAGMGRDDAVGQQRHDDRRRRSGAMLPLLAVVAVVAMIVVGVLAWSLLGAESGGDGDEAAADPGRSRASAPTQQRPDGQDREREPRAEPKQKSPAAGKKGAPQGGEEPETLFTPEAMTQAVAEYYAIMPKDTKTGFRLLGPTLRSQGFDAYDDFWDGIDSVSVSDLEADPESRSVTGTVTFVTDDGGTSVERHRFGLVPDESGDGLLIDTDTPIG